MKTLVTANNQKEFIVTASKLTNTQLAEMLVTELRALVRNLGVNVVEREGEFITLNKARHGELCAAVKELTLTQKLLDATAPENSAITEEILKQLKQSIQLENGTELGAIAGDIYQEYYRTIHLCLNMNQSNLVEEFLKIPASLLTAKITDYRSYKGEEITDTTKANYRGMIFGYMNDFISQESEGKSKVVLLKHFDEFKHLCFEAMSEVRKGKVKDDKANLRTRKNDKNAADVSRLLVWANTLLLSLDENTKVSKWKEVSIAVAFTCGRRQTEIHGDGEVELTDNPYELKFTGQAKTKGLSKTYYEQNPSYNIPTLIPAATVFKGWEWLKNIGKSDKTPKEVNDNYNKEIGSILKDILVKQVSFYETLDYQLIENPELISLKQKTQFAKEGTTKDNQIPVTYHSLRAWYALAAYNSFGKSVYKSKDCSLFSGIILGHDRTLTGTKGEGLTAQRYMADFEIMSGTTTHL